MKKKLRELRTAEVEALGVEAPPKAVVKTIENTRAHDDSFCKVDDPEVVGDEKDDEFANYFNSDKRPKMMITTRPKCSKKLFAFIADLMQMIPNLFYYPRGQYDVKELVTYASNKGFTHLIILGEKQKECNR